MKYLKILTAVFIGVLTLMSSRNVKAQNDANVTIELCRIKHTAQNNLSTANRFRIILSVRETQGDREIYNAIIPINPSSSIVTKEIPNNRIEDLDIDADAELIIRVEATSGGMTSSSLASRISSPSEFSNIGRLNADRTFDTTLNLSQGNRNSGIKIRGKIRVQ